MSEAALAVRSAGRWRSPRRRRAPRERSAPPPPGPAVIHPEEKHFRNLRQVTSGGENAEGYWSPDGREIIYQRRNAAEGLRLRPGVRLRPGERREPARLERQGPRQLRLLPGRRTPRALRLDPPRRRPRARRPPDYSKGYVWPMYQGYDIVSHALDGSDVKRLTDTPGYDAEATLSPDGKTIVFTSVRDGDLEIYTMASRRLAA